MKGVTHRVGQEQLAPRGVMLAQQLPQPVQGHCVPQECVWHTAPSLAAMELCGVQPAAGGMAAPHRRHSAVLHFAAF